jgi:hypothetical protein
MILVDKLSIYLCKIRLMNQIAVMVANETHLKFAETICNEMEASAKMRGTGIAKRTPSYIQAKMLEGKAVIAITKNLEWAGFCYIETWQNEAYVANSGLIVAPKFRKEGLATKIKSKIFELSLSKYPEAKLFGLTTGLAVMKINSDLGYEPVTYGELTTDMKFWDGCKSCVNYDILTSKAFKNCLCTGMLFNPLEKKLEVVTKPKKEIKINKLLLKFINNLKENKNKVSLKLYNLFV